MITNVFQVQVPYEANVVSLRSDNYIVDTPFQNQKLYVQPSLLQSCHTGNLIGYGLFVKPQHEIIADKEIGRWNGSLLALSTTERQAKIRENPEWQFYAVSLQLGQAVLECIRMDANLPINPSELYFGK